MVFVGCATGFFNPTGRCQAASGSRLFGLVIPFQTTMNTSSHISNRTSHAALSPLGARGFAARNLELLAAIESTLDALAGDTDLIAAITNGYVEIKDRLAGFQGEVDPDGRIAQLLEKAADTCSRIYRDAQQRHTAASTDKALRAEDGVADAYSSFMAALNQMHDAVDDLKEWIGLHDALLQPSSDAVYATTDELFEALLKPR